MSPSNKKFERKLGERRYKKMFIVASEGQKTEPQYFSLLQNQNSFVKIFCLRSGKASSPQAVLKRMKEYIRKDGLKFSYGPQQSQIRVLAPSSF